MKNKYFIPVLFMLCSINGLTQDFENYKRQQQEKFEKFQKESENQIKQFDESFKLFVQKKNEEFAKYIEKNWIAFNTIKGEKRPEIPKPDNIPVSLDVPNELKPKRIEPIGVKQIDFGNKPVQEIIRFKKPDYSHFLIDKNISFSLYGQEIEIRADPDIFCSQQIAFNQLAINQLWNDIIASDYSELLYQLYDYKNKLNLNDWGYFKLCDATAKVLSKENTNYKRAITWALMNLSGYRVKIGISDQSCHLMIPTLQKIYSTYSMNINNEKYYILDFKGDKIHTYEQDFKGADKYLDLNIYRPLNLAENIRKTKLTSKNSYNWEIEVNKNVIDFYNDYPLVDFSVYFNAPMTPVTKNSLIAKLNTQLEGKTDRQKVELLLHFVQNAFHYKTDMEQFGREKFFFPDECFFYPYSDCEDRSVLFSYLVRWFLDYDVLGVQYPLPLATAVALPGTITGDYIEFNGENYTICDPTFINASIGMTMPEYIGIKPSIFQVSNLYSNSEKAEKLWSGLEVLGASKTCMQNYCFDDSDNLYLTGSFSGLLTYGEKSISSNVGETDVFVACFDPKGVIQWISGIDFGTNDFINGITFKKNSLYLCGNSSTFNANEHQAFITSFSASGEQIWKSLISINTSLSGENINSTYHLSFDGKIISQELLYSGNLVSNPGIFTLEDGIIVILNFSNSMGLRTEDIVIVKSSELSIVDRLKNEYDRIILKNCEPYTAAVLAVLNLMNSNGMFLTGDEISNILETNSHEIETDVSGFLKNLKKVEYFKNENGRITLKTKDGKGIVFYKMYLSDKASFKIADVSGQKKQIDCLSGIMVGNTVLKFPLNSITIDLRKGDFLFDYGKDNSKENVNLKRDILEI